MEPKVTDVWFRSKLRLIEIAQRLGMLGVSEDVENDWAWVVGALGETRLDITRTHTRPAGSADTRVFVLDAEFTDTLLAEVVGRLQTFVSGPIMCDRWEYRSGNDFDLVVVQEFSSDGGDGVAESRYFT